MSRERGTLFFFLLSFVPVCCLCFVSALFLKPHLTPPPPSFLDMNCLIQYSLFNIIIIIIIFFWLPIVAAVEEVEMLLQKQQRKKKRKRKKKWTLVEVWTCSVEMKVVVVAEIIKHTQAKTNPTKYLLERKPKTLPRKNKQTHTQITKRFSYTPPWDNP